MRGMSSEGGIGRLGCGNPLQSVHPKDCIRKGLRNLCTITPISPAY